MKFPKFWVILGGICPGVSFDTLLASTERFETLSFSMLKFWGDSQRKLLWEKFFCWHIWLPPDMKFSKKVWGIVLSFVGNVWTSFEDSKENQPSVDATAPLGSKSQLRSPTCFGCLTHCCQRRRGHPLPGRLSLFIWTNKFVSGKGTHGWQLASIFMANIFFDFEKYNFQFWQILFSFSTNTIFDSDKYKCVPTLVNPTLRTVAPISMAVPTAPSKSSFLEKYVFDESCSVSLHFHLCKVLLVDKLSD